MIRRRRGRSGPSRRERAIFFRNHGPVYSAAIAFNILFSAIPILFLAFAAAGWIIGKSDLPFAQLTELLRNTFPYGARCSCRTFGTCWRRGSTFGIFGTLLLLFTSFTATDAVHTSLSVMLMRKRQKKFRRSLGFHVVFVIALIVLTAAAIVVPPLWEGSSTSRRGCPPRVDLAVRSLLRLDRGHDPRGDHAAGERAEFTGTSLRERCDFATPSSAP